ncbi:centrosomal protein of 83 kDa-like [Gouania willdenowi]|uniref:centrosomal protein of 83 kDa-like n=1 Tax=Gouania willdenowi TaxID=441366 RepID=UPI0010561B0D|nr:centrosomal protein of 83 kDa-like [Gouania willdenowi]
MSESISLSSTGDMPSTGPSSTNPVVQNLDPGVNQCAAMLGLSAGLEGAELELHKMLIVEKMTNETHKSNYQTLKMEHLSLQNEFTHVQSELRRLQSDQQSEQEKVQLLFAELQGELLDKSRELEDLRLQVMTPQRLELLRVQVQQEMEAPVRERFTMLEQETEKYRAEYNRVRYDYTILKAQFDHQTNEHARVLEDRRMRYEAEIVRLEKDREDLVAQYQESDSVCDSKRVETLLGEIVQLHLRMKGFEAELAELYAQKENARQQAESMERIQNRQLSESQGALKILEAERLSLRQHLERMENELGLSDEQSSLVSGKLHKAEREIGSLCSQLESLKYSHKMEMGTVELDCARAKGEMEREKDALQRQIDDLQTDVEVVTEALERLKEVLLETQRETVRMVRCAREEELRKFTALLEEKMQLEHRLESIEHQKALQVASDHNLKKDWEERLHKVQQSEECAHRELHNLRCKLQQQSSQVEELERQKAEFFDLQQQNQELGVQIERLSHSENELKETKQDLQQVLGTMKEELRAAQAQAEKSQEEAKQYVCTTCCRHHIIEY